MQPKTAKQTSKPKLKEQPDEVMETETKIQAESVEAEGVEAEGVEAEGTEASDNYYPYHRRDEKQLMKQVAAGLGFRSVAPAITQIFRHLHQEMERQNICELALTDIKIAKPRRSRRGRR